MKKLDIKNALESVEKAQNLVTSIEKIQPEIEYLLKFIPELLPEMRSIFQQVKDVFPKVQGIRKKVEHSISEMPSARTKIESVNKETESSTLGIMDNIDLIMDASFQISEICKQLSQKLKKSDDISLLKQLEELNSKNQEKLDNIFADLQFQDITSQQLYAARNILIDISNSLGEITDRFEYEEDDMTGTFDKAASMDKAIKDQDLVDQIINSKSI